jgi:hypothetical protein
MYDTYMSKLTLSVDRAVVDRAKAYAERTGTSLSELVERYFEELTRARPAGGDAGRPADGLPPITARLAGVLAGDHLGLEDYREYLDEKYR